jgi:hypothetical protein
MRSLTARILPASRAPFDPEELLPRSQAALPIAGTTLAAIFTLGINNGFDIRLKSRKLCGRQRQPDFSGLHTPVFKI